MRKDSASSEPVRLSAARFSRSQSSNQPSNSTRIHTSRVYKLARPSPNSSNRRKRAMGQFQLPAPPQLQRQGPAVGVGVGLTQQMADLSIANLSDLEKWTTQNVVVNGHIYSKMSYALSDYDVLSVTWPGPDAFRPEQIPVGAVVAPTGKQLLVYHLIQDEFLDPVQYCKVFGIEVRQESSKFIAISRMAAHRRSKAVTMTGGALADCDVVPLPCKVSSNVFDFQYSKNSTRNRYIAKVELRVLRGDDLPGSSPSSFQGNVDVLGPVIVDNNEPEALGSVRGSVRGSVHGSVHGSVRGGGDDQSTIVSNAMDCSVAPSLTPTRLSPHTPPRPPTSRPMSSSATLSPSLTPARTRAMLSTPPNQNKRRSSLSSGSLSSPSISSPSRSGATVMSNRGLQLVATGSVRSHPWPTTLNSPKWHASSTGSSVPRSIVTQQSQQSNAPGHHYQRELARQLKEHGAPYQAGKQGNQIASPMDGQRSVDSNEAATPR
jgi:hypothetical protein